MEVNGLLVLKCLLVFILPSYLTDHLIATSKLEVFLPQNFKGVFPLSSSFQHCC